MKGRRKMLQNDSLPYQHYAQSLGKVLTGTRVITSHKPHPKWIRASSVGFMCPREWVINYWLPHDYLESKPLSMFERFRMDMGSAGHDVFQNEILGPMRLLVGNWVKDGEKSWGYWPGKGWRFVEEYAESQELGISGHHDGLLSPNRIMDVYKAVKARKLESKILSQREAPEASAMYYLAEFKFVSSEVFNEINTVDQIPEYYRGQAAVYQLLFRRPATVFFFVDRSSLSIRTFFYRGLQQDLDKALFKCDLVWRAIRDETLPDAERKCSTPTSSRAKKCTVAEECYLADPIYNGNSLKFFKKFVAKCKEIASQRGLEHPLPLNYQK